MNETLVVKTEKCLKSCTDRLIEKCSSQRKEINHENCIQLCFEDKVIRKALNEHLQYCEKLKSLDAKNVVLANDEKNKGNAAFDRKDYKEASKKYTKSIFYNKPGNECLPLAYANRSLVFMKLNQFSSSVKDIDMALETGYPKQKIPALKLRKAKLLISMGRDAEGTKILSELLNDSSAKGLHPLVKNELQEVKTHPSRNEKFEWSEEVSEFPALKGGENKNFISGSRHIGLFYDNVKGRHVKATKNIKMGDVLYVEKPFAHLFFAKVCYSCGALVEHLIPCDFCISASYCSVQCKETFWKSTHSFECGFHKFFESIGIAHLSLRVVLAASSSFNELKQKLDNIARVQYKKGPVSIRIKNYSAVYNLEANIEKFEKNDLINYALTAFMLTLYMKNYTLYFSESVRDEDLKLLASTLLRHIAHLICNGNAIYRRVADPEQIIMSDNLDKRIGTAIYVSTSMMNHSCEPSIITSYKGTHVIVRAVKDIKEGEEIFNCYGPHARRMTRDQRHVHLSSQYFFNCECRACSQEVDIMEVFRAWKCPSCEGPCVTDHRDSRTPQRRLCLSCDNILIPPLEQVLTSHLIEGVLEDEGSNLMDYLKAWKVARKLYYKHHESLNRIMNEMSGIFYQAGLFDRAIKCMSCCLSCIERQYGSQSIELAGQKEKFVIMLIRRISFMLERGEEKEARSLYRQCLKYFNESSKISRLLLGENESTKAIHTILSMMPMGNLYSE